MKDNLQLITSRFSSIGMSSSSSTDIIPYYNQHGEQQYIVVPTVNSDFDNAINVKETAHHLWLSPYDLYEEAGAVSIADIINGNIKKGDSIYETFKYKVSEEGKELFAELTKQSAYELSELLIFAVSFLEEYPTICYTTTDDYGQKVKKERNTTPDDVIRLLKVLTRRFHIDRVIEILENSTVEEITMLLSSDSDAQITIFKKLESSYDDVA